MALEDELVEPKYALNFEVSKGLVSVTTTGKDILFAR
jgi:hypothetical protein